MVPDWIFCESLYYSNYFSLWRPSFQQFFYFARSGLFFGGLARQNLFHWPIFWHHRFHPELFSMVCGSWLVSGTLVIYVIWLASLDSPLTADESKNWPSLILGPLKWAHMTRIEQGRGSWRLCRLFLFSGFVEEMSRWVEALIFATSLFLWCQKIRVAEEYDLSPPLEGFDLDALFGSLCFTLCSAFLILQVSRWLCWIFRCWVPALLVGFFALEYHPNSAG